FLIGGAVLASGIVIFLTQTNAFASARSATLGAVATGVGLAIVFAPWLTRLYHQAIYERLQRIRSEERSEMSAHLHDSVLQTLALIKRPDVPPDVLALARRQERELRAWMQGGNLQKSTGIRHAIEDMVGDVEDRYRVSVDAVVVGEVSQVGETDIDMGEPV